ncbi:Uncharacterised protein [Actinomadura madurae]|nr:Uncharacterised protein [Actinomadura madurae]
MSGMNPPNGDWIMVVTYENLPRCPRPVAALLG